ncbi:hypothetical protein ACHAXS_010205 [Conticribra weissflogii]
MVIRAPSLQSCCIGIAWDGDDNSDKPSLYSATLVPLNLSENKIPCTFITTSASEFEMTLKAQLKSSCDDVNASEESVQFFANDDAHWLKCRPMKEVFEDGVDDETRPFTILGISECSVFFAGEHNHGNGPDGDITVNLSILEPDVDAVFLEEKHVSRNPCHCNHPRGDWRRSVLDLWSQDVKDKRESLRVDTISDENYSIKESYCASVKIINLTKMQTERRKIAAFNNGQPCFDTPGRVFHLLRSVLVHSELHSASPWRHGYHSTEGNTIKNHSNSLIDADKATNIIRNSEDTVSSTDLVVALLVRGYNTPDDNLANYEEYTEYEEFWNELEEKELNELMKFRTSDAAPSYYLHSSTELSGYELDNPEKKPDTPLSSALAKLFSKGGEVFCPNMQLLVYRHLPPRDILKYHHPESDEKPNFVGCLWETYLEDLPENDLTDINETPEQKKQIINRRLVSPPYLSCDEEYPGLLDNVVDNIAIIREEAKRIPLWTAWPETSHYSYDQNTDSASAPWTVFPLCHTFPADNVSQRKFIHKTCSFVPETTKLLQGLGKVLRTALFSRLEPRTTLGTHTGWSDLANHVLRVHIPLIVPGGPNSGCLKSKEDDDSINIGLCGTWVDGCVETHDEGRVICFDDSKVHRAFNYSDEERVVLIIDLARNTSGPMALPLGTATGGHTEELDAFIKELT